jgi:putative endonuclease
MTVARRHTGQIAEDLVAARLTKAGWKILARNARSRYGEIDIVALDGRALVFLEVKAARLGSQAGPERPVLSVGHRKQRQVRRLSVAWMAERRNLPHFDEIRFDAVGVTLGRDDRPLEVEHIRGAF